MTGTRRARPAGDADSLPFWEGCDREALLGQRCGRCGVWRWPPCEYCAACHAAAPVWETLPGTGRILGYAVVHRPMDPAMAKDIPLTIVHVEMDGTDGEMVLISNLQPGEWERVTVGARVRVRFDRLEQGNVPKFTLQKTET